MYKATIKSNEMTKIVSTKNPKCQNPLKMYILIRDFMDVGHAVNSCAHAGAMIESHFPRVIKANHPKSDMIGFKKDPIMAEWYADSFRKVTCKVDDKTFEKAKEYEDYFVVTEMAFDNEEVALVFKPRREWPKFFKFLSLYK